MNFGWKSRVGVVLSAVWLCVVYLFADGFHRVEQVLGLGLMPMVVIWGVVWAVAGWRAQRPTTTPHAAQLEAQARRSVRIRTAVAVVTVLGIGLFVATSQFKAAGNEDGGNVARWFGEWLVWGLVAYAILRAVPRLPAGFAAVATALIIVGAVNYKAYELIAEDQQALDSLAKATPLINKIHAGTPVSDQEVRDARVGMFETLMLAQATYTREAFAIGATYEKTIAGMQPELMLTPSSLVSPSIRMQTRAKLKLWQQASAVYQSQLEGATTRGKLALKAAQSQMPAALSRSALKGFDEATFQQSAFVTTQVTTQREVSNAIVNILDLMDANPGSYVVDKGPPVNLLFRDEPTLAKYRELMGSVMALSQREQEEQARFTQAQVDRTAKLVNLFKR